MKYDVVIAGCGVVGAMTAREFSRYDLKVCVLEKENDVSMGASRANSGIIHGGYDPVPGTLKAEMNILGVPLLYEAAKDLSVPFKQNGSMVCAFGKEEEGAIRALYERGLANGVEGLRVLTGDEARELEPNLSKALTLALLVPTGGIISPYELTVAAMGNAMDNGADLKLNFEVAAVARTEEGFTVSSAAGETVTGRIFINAAGGFSDRVAEMAGDCDFAIIPRAGEYMILDKEAGDTVSRTIFQVPTKDGKGILVCPTVHGNLLTGPTALPVGDPESRETTPAGLEKVAFLAKKSVPGVDFSKVITSFSGVRSSVASGDFIIRASETVPGLIHLAAIDSPGLTSCVAIARRAVELAADCGIALTPKANWDGTRPDPDAFRRMTDEEKDACIKERPDYGHIICRCEGVSEGEIRDAIRRNPGARDVDGVKRRVRAGMGRCQGGFCAPYVMRLISEETGIPMVEVTKSGKGSRMITGGRIGEEADQ
ncbi:MAG: FAD-dependent oxidoreductase [Clostridia bacterium]|nr:FAD-dependent oxidoreductase [Clostridia bacterium]